MVKTDASITYLCSCEESKGRRELSQWWKSWEKGPESGVGVAASPSSARLWSPTPFRVRHRNKMLSPCWLIQSLPTGGVNVCCSSGLAWLEWLDYFSELVALRTSAAHWNGLLAAPATCIPRQWREGADGAGHTHSHCTPPPLLLFHFPSHTVFLWKRSESFLQASCRSRLPFSSLLWVWCVPSNPTFHPHRPFDAFNCSHSLFLFLCLFFFSHSEHREIRALEASMKRHEEQRFAEGNWSSWESMRQFIAWNKWSNTWSNASDNKKNNDITCTAYQLTK